MYVWKSKGYCVMCICIQYFCNCEYESLLEKIINSPHAKKDILL